MFDGHSGYYTSRLMADQLEKYVGRELMEVLQGGYKSLTVTGEGWWNWLWNASKGQNGPVDPAAASNTPELQVNDKTRLIPEALRTAYKLADKDIMTAPVEYMNSLGSPNPGSISEEQRLKGLSLLQPALSGSCSLSTLIDCSGSQLYVAVAGDSRAVMGTYDPESKKWKAETLSEDQTGRSAKEVERVRSEHPKNENDTVIMRGRVLGGLEPTRSFGDGKYKLCVCLKVTCGPID
jgi:pyruvate dehydrogenase phosphatase